MSTLTEVTLWADILNDREEIVSAITASIAGEPFQALVELDVEAAGGSKFFCGKVYAACFNYVSPERVIEHLEAVPWHGAAVAVIDYEHDDEPRVWQVPR